MDKMLDSVEIALKFEEEKLPMIPGLKDDRDVRAVLALHIEQEVFTSTKKAYTANIQQIFEDLMITDEDEQKKIIDVYTTYKTYVAQVFSYLEKKGDETKAARGVREFKYETGPYIYIDKEEEVWCVDLEKLNENEAKFDHIDLYEGQVIIRFDPKEPRKDMTVIVGDVPVRRDGSSPSQAQMQAILQQLGAGGAQIPPNILTPDEDEDEENVDYSRWDTLIESAHDREVILTFTKGEQTGRL